MKVLQRNTLPVVVVTLLLILAMAITASGQAYPKPAAVPPVSAKLPPAQTVSAGFDDLGFIQYASVDQMCNATPGGAPLDTTPGKTVAPAPAAPAPAPPGCKTSGGWIQINNDLIRVPANVVVVFPNTYLTWEEMFENNPGSVMCTGPSATSCTLGLVAPKPGESGLALSDTVRSIYTHEAHVQGHIVHGQYMAGLIFISQQSVNGMQGFIEKLNYADGSMTINGTRVQINDPAIQLADMNGVLYNKGRYSIGQSPDSRFSADQNNPTIRAQTGYPMCIPRFAPGTGTSGTSNPAGGFDDPQCPEVNRPRDSAGNLIMIYTMNVPGATATLDNPFPQDPYTEVPFEVGDFVSIIGTQFQDATGTPFVSATEIVDNLGVYTFPNTDPAYVVIEVLLQGTGGVPDPAFPQEAARRTRVEGFSTDPLRNVDISAIDIDSCGNMSFRLPTWVSNFPVEQGLPLIGKKGRWRFRPNGGTFLPPVQNVGVQVSGGLIGFNNNGLTYDYYQLPNPEFIFPEDLVPGNLPPSFNFGDLPFLVNGTGPWPTPATILDSQLIQLGAKRAEVPQPQATQFIGQLNPWPDKAAPQATACNAANQNAATAVASFTSSTSPITAGTLVTLNSAGSKPQNGPFSWQQIVNPGDPIITITNPTSATATFTAPVVATSLNISIQLTVGGTNTSTPSSTTIQVPIVVAPKGTPPAVSAIANPNPVTGDGASIVTLTATGVDPNGGKLTFTWTAPAGITLKPAAADGSVQTFVAPNLAPLSAPLVLSFKVTATTTAPAVPPTTSTVAVTVNPSSDLITISHVRYIKRMARLTVSASDFTPGVTLTVTLAGPNGESPTINPATGQPYTGVMGPVIPSATGVFDITFANVPAPDLVTIRSSAGGIITSGVTITR